MTISSQNRKAGPFVGNDSSTVFPFAFKVFAASDLYVVKTDTTLGADTVLELTTDYTVSLNANQDANPGGTVTLPSVLATGFKLTITSSLQYLQPTDLTNNGGFYPKVITNALDRLTIFVQQIAERLGRSLTLPISVSGVSTELPVPAPNKLIAWNQSATGLQSLDPQALATIVAFGTANADTFNGDGVTTQFVLSANPGALNNLDVSIGGVTQTPGADYTWTSGTTITFTSAPPVGTGNVLVRYMQALPQGQTAADLVSATDGASGTLWSNVQGFIDKLLSSAGASVIGFLQAGAAAVSRTLQSKVREISVSVTDFGPIGNSTTGDDATFQAALDYIHKLTDDSGAFGTLDFTGTIYLASPKKFGKNTRLAGKGRGFKSVFKPLASFSGSYLFSIDGDDCIGGYAFRIRHEGFTIDNSLIATKAQVAKTYVIDKAYDIALRDVWLYNVRGTGIEIGASNLVLLEDLSLYGAVADPTNSEYGIRVLSAGSGGGGGGVKIVNPDIEVWYKGISQEGGSRVEIINPYAERNIVGWIAAGTTAGSLTVVGGEIESPGASGTAANISGNNVTVLGGIYNANGGNGLYVDTASRRANVKLIGVSGDISDARNYAYKEVTDTTRWYPSKVRNQKTVSDAVATTFYNIICPFVSSYFGVCEVTVNGRDSSGYSLWTAKYRFAFSNPDGTLRATAVTEYGKANVNISGNYSLAVTCALSNSGTTISFQVTADAGGALGNGTSPIISTEAELVQWDSAGAVYIQAV